MFEKFVKRNVLRKILSVLLAVSLLLLNTFYLLPTTAYAASSPWTQTDWSGGSGQTNWSDNTKFYSSSSVTTSTAGQATLTNTEKFSNTGFETDLTGWDTGVQPDSISGLTLWLKADAIAGLNDGAAVSSWSDSSGSGNNATQSTEAGQPTYKTNILNGKPVVRFNGTNYLQTANVVQTGQLYSMFTVVKTTQSNSRNPIISNGVSGGYTLGYHLKRTINRLNRIEFADGAIVLNTWEIWSATQAPGPIPPNLYINGVSQTLSYDRTDMFSTPDTSTGIGGQPNGTCNTSTFTCHTGDIAEVIVFNTNLSSANRARIENYLRDKYNITVTSGITSATRDTTTKYTGNASVKLVTSSTDTGEFTQSVNVGDTNVYNLSAYAYTDGSAVTSSDLELFYNGSTVSTTYTSAGSGWYQLTGTVTRANASRQYGVQVKANKTVYVMISV